MSEGYLHFPHMGTIFMGFRGPETVDFWCFGGNTESWVSQKFSSSKWDKPPPGILCVFVGSEGGMRK